MKKLVYLLSCLLLLSAGFTVCSCDSDDSPEQQNPYQNETPVDSATVDKDTTEIDSTEAYTVISAVPASEEVNTFFDEALPFSYDKPAYFKPYVDLGDDNGVHILSQWVIYSVFNSKEEMQEQYIGDADLPDIDFDKYTLIIGTSHMDKMDFLKAVEVRSYAEINELTVIIDLQLYGAIEFYPFRFWAIFPKLQGSINRIDYIKKDKDGRDGY